MANNAKTGRLSIKLTKKIISAALVLSVSMGVLAVFSLTGDSAAVNWDTISA